MEDAQEQKSSGIIAGTADHITSLTGLRFFAALWVVLLHFGTPQHTRQWPSILDDTLRHGQLGVSMFFVLSGFVLGYNYLDKIRTGTFDIRSFFVARFARVYPVFILSVVVFSPFAIRHTFQTQHGLLPWLLLGAELLLQILVLQTWYPSLLYLTRWNTPTWSLGVEAFFYATFPWLARKIGMTKSSGAILSISCLFAFLALVRFAYWKLDLDAIGDTIPTDTDDFWAGVLFYNPIFRLPEFAIGILGVHLLKRNKSSLSAIPEWVHIVVFGAILLGLVCLLSFQHTVSQRIWSNPAVVFLLFALICVVSLQKIRVVTILLSSSLLVLLGEASYSMYVLQRPVAEYFNFVAVRIGLGTIETDLSSFFVYLVILTVISIVVYRKFEIAWRKRIRKKFGAVVSTQS